MIAKCIECLIRRAGTLVLLTLAVTALTLEPRRGSAQAAAAYGIAAGSSATTTAKTASTINRATNKLAGRVADSVSKSGTNGPSRSLAKPYEVVMEENRRKLEEQSKDGAGTLHIESTPAKATVLIDGQPVAKTPADLQIPAGKHAVELKEFESVSWRKEITLARGETLTLTPELKKRYQSAITLSFDREKPPDARTPASQTAPPPGPVNHH